MKIEIPLEKLCHIHNGLEILVSIPAPRKHESALRSVGRRIQGALERSGAVKVEQGWKVSERKFSVRVRFELSRNELEALLYLLAAILACGNEEVKATAKPVLDDLLQKRASLSGVAVLAG
ncbi:MAG: hypothetical protein PHV43_03085 [Candidatus Colwellbacteria bacterium]|nr:hypothetical protein [Candidatus Colwellbacteria bacterium]